MLQRGLFVLLCTAACRTDAPADAPSPTRAANPAALADSTPAITDEAGTYLGRPIAPTMSHLGADWLTRPERDAEEDSRALHARLGLRPGDVACDVGAGNGYHTIMMARAVAPGGRVIAVDLQPQMLALLAERAAAEHVANVELVQASASDPHLPADTCDLVLLVDVYHELDEPAAVLGHLRRALTERGRIALVEFRGEDPDVPIKPEHKMTKAQILREYEANGLALASEFEGLPWQHLMFFQPAR